VQKTALEQSARHQLGLSRGLIFALDQSVATNCFLRDSSAFARPSKTLQSCNKRLDALFAPPLKRANEITAFWRMAGEADISSNSAERE